MSYAIAVDGPYREGAAPTWVCPRCRQQPLSFRPLADEAIEECTACRGYFVPRALIPRLLDALDLGGEVLQTFERETPQPTMEGPLYIRCPICDRHMNRRLFAWGARVVIDECRAHGIWFDRAELRAVVEFAAGGGMERAAALEARNKRQEEQAARLRPTVRTYAGEHPETESTLFDFLWGLLSGK